MMVYLIIRYYESKQSNGLDTILSDHAFVEFTDFLWLYFVLQKAEYIVIYHSQQLEIQYKHVHNLSVCALNSNTYKPTSLKVGHELISIEMIGAIQSKPDNVGFQIKKGETASL